MILAAHVKVLKEDLVYGGLLGLVTALAQEKLSPGKPRPVQRLGGGNP